MRKTRPGSEDAPQCGRPAPDRRTRPNAEAPPGLGGSILSRIREGDGLRRLGAVWAGPPLAPPKEGFQSPDRMLPGAAWRRIHTRMQTAACSNAA